MVGSWCLVRPRLGDPSHGPGQTGPRLRDSVVNRCPPRSRCHLCSESSSRAHDGTVESWVEVRTRYLRWRQSVTRTRGVSVFVTGVEGPGTDRHCGVKGPLNSVTSVDNRHGRGHSGYWFGSTLGSTGTPVPGRPDFGSPADGRRTRLRGEPKNFRLESKQTPGAEGHGPGPFGTDTRPTESPA